MLILNRMPIIFSINKMAFYNKKIQGIYLAFTLRKYRKYICASRPFQMNMGRRGTESQVSGNNIEQTADTCKYECL
jgi:hypothetical protein